MSTKRIDAVYIIGDIFIEGDIVKVTFDFNRNIFYKSEYIIL